jgi:hypothetical protein
MRDEFQRPVRIILVFLQSPALQDTPACREHRGNGVVVEPDVALLGVRDERGRGRQSDGGWRFRCGAGGACRRRGRRACHTPLGHRRFRLWLGRWKQRLIAVHHDKRQDDRQKNPFFH